MIKRESLNFNEEKLLFDILQELKEINQKLTPTAQPEPARPIAKATEGKPEKPKFYRKCKKCGREFDNYGLFMRHMKDHKKEGA
jgi:hypothetical protein